MSLRTPLGRVLGLGSARRGSEHWWAQRVSALALVPLTLWFLIAVLRLPTLNFGMARIWLSLPLNAFLAGLLVAALAHHSYLGTSTIVEDYVHAAGAKIAGLLALRFAHLLSGAAAVFAILRIAFGAPVT